ncbi:hypothetical protein OROMI_013338 [Orobanche minor]
MYPIERFHDYVETKFNRLSRNEVDAMDENFELDVFKITGYGISKVKATVFERHVLNKAHQYVLFNCEAISPYREQHLAVLKDIHPQDPSHLIKCQHTAEFPEWFAENYII